MPAKSQTKPNERHYYPTPKQEIALGCPCKTIFFGGARGGGKSHCCRFLIMKHAEMYKEDARMIFMRRSLKELEQFIDKCKIMFAGLAEWKEQKKRFEFKNSAVCEFNYLEGESVHNYQGAEFTLIILDEVGQFDDYGDVKMLKGCLRSSAGVPCQLFMTGNPGGRLHNILKAEFIDPAPQGMVPIMDTDETGRPLGTYRVYIPSTLFENPYLFENDPEYISNLLQVGSPEMVRAWIKGDWNIISGGAFDKLFDRNIHIIKPFRIPRNWRVVSVYDDGLSKPYALTIFAISDGSDYYLPNGERRATIRGDIFVIAELYGWKNKPNKGTHESTAAKAERIKNKEAALGYVISEHIADSAIFSQNGNSIADEFETNGVFFTPCNKSPGSRLIAANLFRNRLMGALNRIETPGIFWFNTCIHNIRTIPTLPRDKNSMDDVDSDAEDHCLHGDTIVHTLEYGSVPIRELVGKNGHCMTAGGYYAAFSNCRCFQKDAEMLKITTVDNSSITCTPDHRILMDTLNYSEAEKWKSKSFQKLNRISMIRPIINAATISSERESDCTSRYGAITSEKFPLALSSTTWMETATIIRSAISRLSPIPVNMPEYTSGQNPGQCQKNASPAQSNGTKASPGGNGTKNIMSSSKTSFTGNTSELAKFAENLLSPNKARPNTVAHTTETLPEKPAESTTSNERALSAERALLLTNIYANKPAPGYAQTAYSVKSVETVDRSDAYCLTTDGTHCLVVNEGFVVANCYDTVAYLLLSFTGGEAQTCAVSNVS